MEISSKQKEEDFTPVSAAVVQLTFQAPVDWKLLSHTEGQNRKSPLLQALVFV